MSDYKSCSSSNEQKEVARLPQAEFDYESPLINLGAHHAGGADQWALGLNSTESMVLYKSPVVRDPRQWANAILERTEEGDLSGVKSEVPSDNVSSFQMRQIFPSDGAPTWQAKSEGSVENSKKSIELLKS